MPKLDPMSTSSDSSERQTGADDTSSSESVSRTASQDNVGCKAVLTTLTERHRSLLRQFSPTSMACSYKLAFDTQASGELLDAEPPPAMDDDITGSTCMPSLHLPFLRSYRFPPNRQADLITARDLQRGWLVCNCRHRLNAVCIHSHRCPHGRAADEIPEGVGNWVSRRRAKDGKSKVLSSSHRPTNSQTSSSGSSLPEKVPEIPFFFRHLEQPVAYIQQYRHDYTYRQMMTWQVDDASTSLASGSPGASTTKSLPVSINRQRTGQHGQLHGRLRHITEGVETRAEASLQRGHSTRFLQSAHVPLKFGKVHAHRLEKHVKHVQYLELSADCLHNSFSTGKGVPTEFADNDFIQGGKPRSFIRPPPIDLSRSIQQLNSVGSKMSAHAGSSAPNATAPYVTSDDGMTSDEKVTSAEHAQHQEHVTNSAHYVSLPQSVNGAVSPRHGLPSSSSKPKLPWRRNSYLMRTPSAAFTAVLRMMREQELGETPKST